MAGLKAVYGCIKAFSARRDFTDDLKKFDVPTLILHGDDDQIVPIDATGRRTVTLVKDAKLIEVEGAPHGMCTTHKDRINTELLKFFQDGGAATGARRETAAAGRA